MPPDVRLPAFREIAGQSLGRDDLRALVGQTVTLVDCDLEEADLSGLDLSGWRFERCGLRRTDFGCSMTAGS
ncbi:MAG: pentapeptide repeat-containing protein [Caulobacter sp.]|nr:pentapeptide repeat-containing protein [Caulobacter sp.]